ncbi:hypothetical protein JOB18_007525 [Solea senegalensis]|uniref:Uncharacterized protein n=1 Tax=Solea senegalensis TaxID=28829 RepID=A0AAV6RY57_SOLSE|nr:hypothetical protein JOB18_007525 [Solea senegalensis]
MFTTGWSRSRRFGRRGLDVAERKPLEFRALAANVDRRSSVYLQAAVKLANAAHVLSRPKHLRAEQTANIPLPPISGSNTSSGKVEPPHRKEAVKLKETGNVTPQTPAARSCTCGTFSVSEEPQARAARSCTCGTFSVSEEPQTEQPGPAPVEPSVFQKNHRHGQPGPAPVEPSVFQKNHRHGQPGPAPVEPSVFQKNHRHEQPGPAPVEPSAAEHDVRRAFPEYQDSEDIGQTERLNDEDEDEDDDDDDEYYTEQRITDWVLKVNTSLFTTGTDELRSWKPAEEQDVSTIKIIYSGDS